MAARYLPATHGMDIGGDFYDRIRLDGTTVAAASPAALHGPTPCTGRHGIPVRLAGGSPGRRVSPRCAGAGGTPRSRHRIRAACRPAVCLVEHPVRLADAGCRAQKDLEPPRPCGRLSRVGHRSRLVRGRHAQNFSGKNNARTRYPTRLTATMTPTTVSVLTRTRLLRKSATSPANISQDVMETALTHS